MKRFEFDVTVEKAWKDKDGKMYVRAIASDDKPDAQQDRMTEVALKGMAEQAKKGLPLLETHRSVFAFGKSTLGEVMKGEKGAQFAVEFELFPQYPQAKTLFDEIEAGGTDKQLSIGGKINSKNAKAVRFEESGTGVVRAVEDVVLDHIATTRKSQAANDRTRFVSAILKSLDGEDVEDGKPEAAVAPGTKKEETVVDKTGKEAAPTLVEAAGGDALKGAEFLRKLGQTLGKRSPGGGAELKEEVDMSQVKEKPAVAATPSAVPGVEKAPEGTPEPKISVGQKVREMVAKFVTGGLNQTQLVTELKGLLATEKSTVGAVEDDMFDAATETVSKASVGKKRLAQLSEVHASLTRILAELKGEPAPAPVVDPPGAGPTEKTKPVDADALEKSISDRMTGALEKTLASFEKTLGEKFQAGQVEIQKEVAELHGVAKDALTANAKLEERLSAIEKAAGVPQSIPGDDAPADGKVEKAAGPWGGMFNKALSRAQSKM